VSSGKPVDSIDSPGRDQANSLVRTAIYALIAAIGGWLILSAVLVDIEYYDGLSAICNSRYFLGLNKFYVFDRGPLMAWLQMPAEALKSRLAQHPLDFRLHHATTALVHAAYLVVVWRALVAEFGSRWSTLAAFTSAITSYIFFSYAPFISHDLFPGALLLWMLIWSEDLARSPRIAPWLMLVAAGTLAPLVKQTYGMFWIAVLAAHVLPTLAREDPDRRTSPRALVWLIVGAATSGLITWIVYGLVLRSWAPDVALWLRPSRNLQYLAHIYDGTDVRFPLWIYVRNLWAYGRLTTLLLIPGLVFSLGGSRLQRRVALAWVTAIVLMHALPLREVRYIAFLAPLAAFLVVPAVRALRSYRFAPALMAGLLLFDVAGAAVEASKVGTKFYRHSELRTLLEPLSDHSRGRAPIVHNISMLSFVAPDQSPLAADRYHRIFHVNVLHVGILYGYPLEQVRVVLPSQAAALSASAPDGTFFLFSSGILAHGPTWVPAPPVGSASLVQGIARLQTVVLRRLPDGSYEGPGDYLMPVAIFGRGDIRPLKRRADGHLIVAGLDSAAPGAGPEPLLARSFVIQRMSTRPTGESR